MQRLAGAAMVLIFVVVLFSIFPLVLTGTDETLTDPSTETGNITTGAGVTTGTISLSPALYNDDITSVTGISSSYGSDTPSASSYNGATDILTVGGLAESQTRTITVEYVYEATSDYTGLTSFVRLAPMLLFMAIIGVIIGALWNTLKG